MTKIIFSRKGFDSSAGGIPSSKRGEHLSSFPIPYEKNTLTTYNHLGLGKDIKELSNNKIKPTDTCHFDPNLDYGEFGQVGAGLFGQPQRSRIASQGHLWGPPGAPLHSASRGRRA